jgi:hypothetical protein
MPPVGSPHCPHCAAPITPDTPMPFGLATCPACARPLFFLTLRGDLAFFRHADAQLVRQLFDALPDAHPLPKDLALDSLDTVELIVEFELALAEAT